MGMPRFWALGIHQTEAGCWKADTGRRHAKHLESSLSISVLLRYWAFLRAAHDSEDGSAYKCGMGEAL
ncbi:hypothetical protein RJT34_20252 [Clitoria ternatea]|uniref:Uncharacterized protein n=1 Tax=Clitoria ternatea TaxID=43366 RepID=A0AAN9ISQ4_CLITE